MNLVWSLVFICGASLKKKVEVESLRPPEFKNYIYWPKQKRNVSDLFIAESPDERNANLQRYLDTHTSWNSMH